MSVDYEIAFIAFEIGSISISEDEDKSTDFVIGIDFGTTYTGVAFAYSGDTTGSDLKKIADDLEVIKDWPNSGSVEKIPTMIAYPSSSGTLWGSSVRSNSEPQVSYFKLGLQPGMVDHYSQRSSQNGSALPFLEANYKHPKLPNKSAVDFAADYLTCVHKYIMDVYFQNKFGEEFLRNQRISYVITVPAIWKDSAKDLTRQAAVRAGIPANRLELITEPEAAALYCATVHEKVDLRDGDCFLICDAGGGTVDLISYEVISRDPFSVTECTEGSGAQCGAQYLTKSFESLLRKKLGSKANDILVPKKLSQALRHFENNIKSSFNPLDRNCETDFEIPLPAADNPALGLEDGFLKLSKEDIRSVYKPIFDKIYELIEKQIQDVQTKRRKKLKLMFLVGGLGSNQFLLQSLKDKFGSRIQIKQPPNGYSAIMRGAVLHKLGLNCIRERVMRRHYGVSYNRTPFKPGKDPQSRRSTNLRGDVICVGAMKWYATKGQKMENGQGVKFPFCRLFSEAEYRAPGPLTAIVELLYCEEDREPEYEIDSVKILCRAEVDLSILKPLPRKYGPKGMFYEASYELAACFGPELLFGMVHQGKVLGGVAAKYS